jgi:hypothetical protein
MTVTAAVAVVLTSTVLYPVFTNSVWFAASMGAVLVVTATGALTRLRTLPVLVCLLASVIGLVLYLNLVFEARHSLLLVIPTPTSISRLADLVGTGISDSRRYAPPVPNLPGLLFLTEAGITAVATDLIAVRLRSTALAGLPLLVLFTVPVMVNAPHSQLATGLVFCLAGAGYLAMLSADGRERIRVWGRLVSLWRTGSQQDVAVGQAGPGSHQAGANGAGVPGAAGRGRPASRARVDRAGTLRPAACAGPAPEQGLHLRAWHRRDRRRDGVAVAAERLVANRQGTAGKAAERGLYLHDRRVGERGERRRAVLQAVRVRHPG